MRASLRHASAKRDFIVLLERLRVPADDIARLDIVEADVLDSDSLAHALEGVSRVFNAAAMVSFKSSDSDEMWNVNVGGTANVCSAAMDAGVQTLLHVSSIGAVGHASEGRLADEDTPFLPDEARTAYSQSKFRQEMEVWRAAQQGLGVVVVNPGVVLGPGRQGRSSMLMLSVAARGLPFFAYGATGYVDARDLADVACRLAIPQHHGERFVCVAHNADVHAVTTLMANALGTKPPRYGLTKNLLLPVSRLTQLFGSPLTPDSVRAMCGSQAYTSQRLINALGGFSFRTLDDSVAYMVDYYKRFCR